MGVGVVMILNPKAFLQRLSYRILKGLIIAHEQIRRRKKAPLSFIGQENNRSPPACLYRRFVGPLMSRYLLSPCRIDSLGLFLYSAQVSQRTLKFIREVF